MAPPMFRRRKRERLYTETEVRAKLEEAIRETGARFTEILGAAAQALGEDGREALAESWDWECHQRAARDRAADHKRN